MPEDLKKEACLRFQAAVENRMAIGDAIEKVQAEVLVKCNDVFKGKRYKGFIKFDYETNVITIHVKKVFFKDIVAETDIFFLLQVNKFAGGNCHFSSGIGTKRMICPDPFMGKLSDPNMHR